MAQQQVSSSQKALMLELKGLQEEPVEGFRITLVDESDLYNWEVAIFGPPNTLYEGGYFKPVTFGSASQPLNVPRNLFCGDASGTFSTHKGAAVILKRIVNIRFDKGCQENP
ncbi:putative Ubiquitin-conjugating enzyme E2 R2-like protein [Naja naja]|nr:putative Ubiquitin-conjugating enzyme E2 R2-like protein [Naja naja]